MRIILIHAKVEMTPIFEKSKKLFLNFPNLNYLSDDQINEFDLTIVQIIF